MSRIIASLPLDRDGALLAAVRLAPHARTADPLEAAAAYAGAGVDEVAFVARVTPIETLVTLSRRAARRIAVPFWVRADPAERVDVEALVSAGCASVALETAALEDPDGIVELARSFGSRAVAVCITARREGRAWRVLAGPEGAATEWEAVTWARVAEAQGAGWLVVESAAGGRHGEPYDLELLEAVASAVALPVVAAGEARLLEDLFDALMIGGADAVLVGGLLHSGKLAVRDAKTYFSERGLGPSGGTGAG